MKKKRCRPWRWPWPCALACQSAPGGGERKVLSRAIEIIGQMESGHNYATVIVDSNGKSAPASCSGMRAGGGPGGKGHPGIGGGHRL